MFSHFQNVQGSAQAAQNTEGKNSKADQNSPKVGMRRYQHACEEGCEAQKWKCESFTSISVFIPACGAAALIPRIPKAHTISSPHSVPPPASSQFTPSPFFPCSALQHQHSAAQGEQFYFHIALGTSSKAASLSLGTVGDILCESEAVCVYREQKRAQFAF